MRVGKLPNECGRLLHVRSSVSSCPSERRRLWPGRKCESGSLTSRPNFARRFLRQSARRYPQRRCAKKSHAEQRKALPRALQGSPSCKPCAPRGRRRAIWRGDCLSTKCPRAPIAMQDDPYAFTKNWLECIAFDDTLSHAACRVAIMIAMHRNRETRDARVGLDMIAAEAGMTKKGARGILQALAKRGLLRVSLGGGAKKTNVYLPILPNGYVPLLKRPEMRA